MIAAAAARSLLLRGRTNKPSLATAAVTTKRLFAAATSNDGVEQQPLVKTALYSLHLDLGGDMVPFAGYELPVLYKSDNGGVMKEHLWCRSLGKSSLFDVSHMGQIRWHGKDRAAFLEKLVVGDIGGLSPGHGCLSLITNANGGIIDDTVITNAGDYIYMVVNGATKFGDIKHFQEQMANFDGDVTMEYLEDTMQLLALQGPGAAEAVKKILPNGFQLDKMAFMTGVDTTLDGVEGCRITRYVHIMFMLCAFVRRVGASWNEVSRSFVCREHITILLTAYAYVSFDIRIT
jgi:aminomethyltransferase